MSYVVCLNSFMRYSTVPEPYSPVSLRWFFIDLTPVPVSPLFLSAALPKIEGSLGSNSGTPRGLARIATRQRETGTMGRYPGGRIDMTWVGVMSVV